MFYLQVKDVGMCCLQEMRCWFSVTKISFFAIKTFLQVFVPVFN